MCGILGLITQGAPVDASRFDQALNTLSHRGPDGRGVYSHDGVQLGHRRLSIIDLSSAGNQPMADPISGCVITFNGEIYNYIELRSQLSKLGHYFNSASDTEVLLRSYLEWGVDCLSRLNGMWAFAIWDPRVRQLFIARDRFGVKPLYYATSLGGIAFASEPKALLALQPSLRKVNEKAVANFLAYSQLYAENESFYQGIKLLPPGHYARISPGDAELIPARFWSLENSQLPVLSDEDWYDEFVTRFSDAVRIRLRSDVPVGLALSGGIDSSCILVPMAERLGEGVSCLTAVYGELGSGELAWAELAASLKCAKVIAVEASSREWFSTFEKITWHMDAPGYSPAVYPVWKIMGAARERGIKVMMEGQGADESFGGYPQYAALHLLSSLRSAALPDSWREYRGLTRTFSGALIFRWLLRESFPRVFGAYQARFGARGLLRREMLKTIDGQTDALRIEHDGHRSPLISRLHQDFSSKILPGLLHYGDAISMGRSVESRLPFMDYKLVEWIFRAPSSMRIQGGTTKTALRRYLGHAGMNKIADRRDKKGYPTPSTQWILGEDVAVAEKLFGSTARIFDYCDRQAIAGFLKRYKNGSPRMGDALYKLASLEMWLKVCI